MGDQLDFSKLLLWKLLLSLSSLDDAFDANYYANWDTTYGDGRRVDSYVNTLIVMDDKDKDNFFKKYKHTQKEANQFLLSNDQEKKKEVMQQRADLFAKERRAKYIKKKRGVGA